ncbi:2-oxo-4-hydroxy-4-carboxy-5-ureidoimidazoline decarboxylase [Klenkia soli]|uniref:2-oxo-4-hydroxy-4-carboxy-5-ureidoimidazoline decarboxylase n=1 Tax=Klenkia soli TaxID=1052260 RepID=A0A1H0F4U2_9ACTN|nr:2-oxo-4-hydroxy-4-carboxy-5-ureidoimidazoline decarboxylase [Klenkia soli]SDN89680.1 2-oxo-4-hydroxy-4-carboxy-5-ureidoimidazoline decarboxylase [Klenkia soli]
MDLHAFDTAPAAELTPLLLACCDVPAWAAAVAAGRPYGDLDALLSAAGAAAAGWTADDVDRALAAHPRIGETAHRGGPEAAWSAAEQAAVDPDAAAAARLAAGNRAYEQRFGRVFLVCATGRTAPEVLAELDRRLTADDETEAATVAAELTAIARLRLTRLVTA